MRSALLHSALSQYQRFTTALTSFSGVPALLLRLYLAPVLIQAGWNKYQAFDSTVAWFANPDWGLGLPAPVLLATLAIAAELLGGVLLLVGLATRLVCLPLIATMLTAIFSVHWPNGWLAIADNSSWLADGTLLHDERVQAAQEKLAAAKAILQQHADYDWLTSSGSLVILNNGIEFAATYLLMLLSLLCTGGGRYLSCDYWLKRRWCPQTEGQFS
ncbi:DoxX family protein [Rheinheimera sp.]|uniref:HvfX family Cu-binding RiPP maturation protein n=1 Tax=Rheinheimera sp. TaxID=1869214 RepID=UPI00307D3642